MSAVAAGSSAALLEAADLRFGQVGMANLRVRSTDAGLLRASLETRVREAPALFERAPVVVDLSFLPSPPADGDAAALLDAVREAGLLPVGLAYGDMPTDALARRLGLPLIAKFRAAFQREEPRAAVEATGGGDVQSPPASEADEPAPPPAATLQHPSPVRTGQQVYAQGADLVVVGPVANGAEVLADGCVHVYGSLRGRAFAGAQGDTGARIFCSEFRAEIVAIAGHYRVFEELPGEFAGRAVQIWLEHDASGPGKLQIAPL